MRRAIWVPAVVVLMTLAAGSAASAKGMEHAKVTITGPGLPGGIVTLGREGAGFLMGSGLYQPKWDAPNVGGTLDPHAELGQPYDVRVVFGCGGGSGARYRQTLYPNAPGGPQLFTPGGVSACGTDVPAGFYSLGPVAADVLERHGIDLEPLAAKKAVEPTAAGGEGLPILATVGLPFVLIALAGGEVVRRRRRNRAA